MESTVIGVFDNYSQAQNALNELTSRGFSRSDIQLSPSEDSPAARQSMLQANEAAQEQSTGGSGIGHFFRSLFGSEEKSEQADVYSEAVRRGSYLLTVNAHNDEQRDEIVNVLDRFDPIDVDERSSQWRAQGWSRYDESAPLLSEEEIHKERSTYTSPQTAAQQNLQDQTNIPVGSEVQRSGARVFQRAGEKLEQAGAQLASGSTGMTMDDTDFRNHWQTTYGHLGGTYDDYKPAYEYGTKLRSDERYGSYRWGDLESEARSNWETNYADSPWEKAKDAVRYAWEKISK